MANSKMDTN